MAICLMSVRTSIDLKAWIERHRFNHVEAAQSLAITIGALRSMLYRPERKLTAQTAYIMDLVDSQANPLKGTHNMAIFAKRHYEWLAAWAGEHLTDDACYELAYALKDENDAFDRNKFIRTCGKADEAACRAEMVKFHERTARHALNSMEQATTQKAKEFQRGYYNAHRNMVSWWEEVQLIEKPNDLTRREP